MRVMVTGADGFVGQHVVVSLKRRGHEVICVGGPQSGYSLAVDLTKKKAVRNMISMIHPEVVLHLAAQSSVHQSWEDPSTTMLVNTVGTLNLWAAAANIGARKLIYISSSEVYGTSSVTERLSEDAPLNPSNPYGVSKATAEWLLQQLTQEKTIDLTILRPFNHIGPGQGESFAIMNFARQLRAIENGGDPVIHVGNLAAIRDFLDVRDVAEAYCLAVETDMNGIYNICSGIPRSIGSILHDLMRLVSVTNIEIQEDKSRLRPTDLPALVGNPNRFMSKTGWIPTRGWHDTLKDILKILE